MTEFINSILQNQYIQILFSAIQFIGWGGISAFVVAILSWRRKIKNQLDLDMLKKADLKELAEKNESAIGEITKLKDELNREHEYNVLTNDAVILLLLSSRRVDGATKLSIAKRAQTLADSEAVRKAAEAAIAAIPEDTSLTEEDEDAIKNEEYAQETDAILNKIIGDGGGAL